MRAENDDANTNIFKIHSYDMIFRRKHKMQCNFERVLSYTVAIFVPLLHKYSNQHAINNKFLYGSLFLQLFISWCNFPSDSLSLCFRLKRKLFVYRGVYSIRFLHFYSVQKTSTQHNFVHLYREENRGKAVVVNEEMFNKFYLRIFCNIIHGSLHLSMCT